VRNGSRLAQIWNVIGTAPGTGEVAAMVALVLDKPTLFITDSYVNDNPSTQKLADITRPGATELRRFGLELMAALLSHSVFGLSKRLSARKMREARALLAQAEPELSPQARCAATPPCPRKSGACTSR
jgi:malate dehydrogenase (oxaloacetate-decarboxylating)(NADP+)